MSIKEALIVTGLSFIIAGLYILIINARLQSVECYRCKTLNWKVCSEMKCPK